MSNPGKSPIEYPVPVRNADPWVPLLNLSTVRERLDSLQQFLWESVNNNTLISKHQMDLVSAEISSAIRLIVVNGAELLACSQPQRPLPTTTKPSDPPNKKNPTTKTPPLSNFNTFPKILKIEDSDQYQTEIEGDVAELDAVELLAEHVHFCEICGKGFKRDANLRMHMRAHGNEFKTPEALAKPDKSNESSLSSKGKTRFSCPFEGCNRNKKHCKFRPLKSVICVRNHFKRSHCPKMYSCNRCNKKSFSVLGDLKSHLKHCGESKWKCSCGTTFSRKDKLFGHMALFEGHMPAIVGEEDEKGKAAGVAGMEEDEEDERMAKGEDFSGNFMDNGFFEGLLDGFGLIEGYSLQDVLGSPVNGMEEFCGFGQR